MQRQLLVAASLFAAILIVVMIAVAPHRSAGNPLYTTVTALTTARLDRPLSITGYVQRSSRHYEGYSQWRFTLEADGGSVPVRYKGVVPSTFEEGAPIMVVGTMQGRTFMATWVGAPRADRNHRRSSQREVSGS